MRRTSSNIASPATLNFDSEDMDKPFCEWEHCFHEVATHHHKTNPQCQCRSCFLAQPRPLPLTLNIHDRPVWEPPTIVGYPRIINEEFSEEKKRELAAACLGGDRVEAAEFMGLDVELTLLGIYNEWLIDEQEGPRGLNDEERILFLETLKEEIGLDIPEIMGEFKKFGMIVEIEDDGVPYVQPLGGWRSYAEMSCTENVAG